MAVPPAVPPILDADRYVSYTVVSSTSVFAVPFPVFGDGNDIDVFYNGVDMGMVGGGWTFSSLSGNPIATIPLPITDAQVTLNTAITSGTLEIIGRWRPRQGILDTSPSLNRREYQEDLGQVVASLREMWTEIWSTFPLSKLGRANTLLGFDSAGNPVAFVTPPIGTVTVSSAWATVISASTYAAGLAILGFSTFFQTLVASASAAALLTTLNFSSFVQTLLSAANSAAFLTAAGLTTVGSALATAATASAAMTTLTFSTFFKTLVTAANAGALLTLEGWSSFVQTLAASANGAQLGNLTGYGAGRRQTVLGGPVDATTGLPTFLPATAVALSITSQNVSSGVPLVVTAANGAGSGGLNDRVGFSATNLTWGSLTLSQTNYLYVTVNADGTLTPSSSIIAPVYETGGAPSVTNHAFTFLIGSMIGMLGNGSAAAQAYQVCVGEAVTNATTVTSTVMYAYGGVYASALAAVPAVSAQATFAHNLGVPPLAYDLELRLVNVTPQDSYTAGMEINADAGLGIGGLVAVDVHNVAFCTLSAVAISVPPYGGGAAVTLTNTDWNLRLYASRNF